MDFQRFGFSDSWHTRGFYDCAAALYHHARGTPPKRLFWLPTSVAGGTHSGSDTRFKPPGHAFGAAGGLT
jgi:hypothetical protein